MEADTSARTSDFILEAAKEVAAGSELQRSRAEDHASAMEHLNESVLGIVQFSASVAELSSVAADEAVDGSSCYAECCDSSHEMRLFRDITS